ncbi:MAG TPA: GAF domain-containing protein [candidate division Zixibacteria bacterium]|nr:GAF domain-containing protein [candidate division Zixibacteria bacterium]
MNDSNLHGLATAVADAVADQNDEESILRRAVEVIDAFSEDFDWTGFYMVRGDHLEVGPYIGPVTQHTRIGFNRGLCGAAASQKKSIIVNDTGADSRFLACSLGTRSEIVVPLMDGDLCLGEIDIDSDQSDFFTEEHRRMLELVAVVVVRRLKEIKTIGG